MSLQNACLNRFLPYNDICTTACKSGFVLDLECSDTLGNGRRNDCGGQFVAIVHLKCFPNRNRDKIMFIHRLNDHRNILRYQSQRTKALKESTLLQFHSKYLKRRACRGSAPNDWFADRLQISANHIHLLHIIDQ